MFCLVRTQYLFQPGVKAEQCGRRDSANVDGRVQCSICSARQHVQVLFALRRCPKNIQLLHKWFCIFPFIAKISSGEGELIHLTQGKSAARKVVWDHTRLPALLACTSRDGRHRVKVWCTEPLFTNLSNHIEKLSGKCCAVTHFGILFIFSYFHNTTAGEMMEQCFRVKISDLPPTEDSNLLLSVQLETEDPGQKSNKRKKTELYCNLLHLNDTNDMEVPF